MAQPVQIPIKSAGHLMSACRSALGITQGELAKAVGAHPKSIHNWETNQTVPDARTWARLVTVLNISNDDAINIWRTTDEA